jgi:2-aminoadipate transaminase
MLQAMKQYFPAQAQFENPGGGMFFWVTLPTYMNAYDILRQGLEQGVAFVPGETFHLNNEGSNTMRLSYSNSTKDETKKGIEILGNIIRKNLK